MNTDQQTRLEITQALGEELPYRECAMGNPAAQCPRCGRFAPATYAAGYDGTWNQEWITTECPQHGKLTQTVV